MAIIPLKEGNTAPTINTPNKIPLNQTDLGSNVNVNKKATFKTRRPWENDNTLLMEDWPNPEVWFNFVISSDEPPEEILERICRVWKMCGGNRLKVKELKTHHTEGSSVL